MSYKSENLTRAEIAYLVVCFVLFFGGLLGWHLFDLSFMGWVAGLGVLLLLAVLTFPFTLFLLKRPCSRCKKEVRMKKVSWHIEGHNKEVYITKCPNCGVKFEYVRYSNVA